MDAAGRVVCYLKGTAGDGLFLHAKNNLQVYGYCDSDWHPLSRRSLTSYFVTLGGSPISWRTKKQARVSRSSAEAEYRAMAIATSELVWVRTFLATLGIFHLQPMKSSSAIAKLPYISPKILSSMRGPSTLKLTVILYAKNSCLASSFLGT